MIEAYTSPPSNKSIGDETLKCGSANAKFEYIYIIYIYSFIPEENDCLGRSPVIDGNIHALNDKVGSDENRGCTMQLTRPRTLTTVRVASHYRGCTARLNRQI